MNSVWKSWKVLQLNFIPAFSRSNIFLFTAPIISCEGRYFLCCKLVTQWYSLLSDNLWNVAFLNWCPCSVMLSLCPSYHNEVVVGGTSTTYPVQCMESCFGFVRPYRGIFVSRGAWYSYNVKLKFCSHLKIARPTMAIMTKMMANAWVCIYSGKLRG